MVFKTLKTKLLILMIALSLVPLTGLGAFAYFSGSKQIADRIRLSLEKMSQDTADKLDVTLKEKREEILSMVTTLPLIYPSLEPRYREGMIRLLNIHCFDHDVYDVLMIVDPSGKIIAINGMDRYQSPLNERKVAQILEDNIKSYPDESTLFNLSIKGQSSQHDWYQSRLSTALYDYSQEDESHQHNIALSEPITNPNTKQIVGVWINIINWVYIQTILDNVELDLEKLNLQTGYAFMFRKDANTIIGHKYRKNRPHDRQGKAQISRLRSFYNTRLIEDHGLRNLHDAIVQHQPSLAYEFPKGNAKISGIVPIETNPFGWVVGVGIDGTDIFRPIQDLRWGLLAVTVALAMLVVVFTYLIAKGITVPIQNLIGRAQTISQGNLSQRVEVRSSDEVGILGAAFNDMARSLSAREEEFQDLNKNLEEIVRQRTSELEASHEALKKAYLDLQSAQEQLVQTEKMASLGQLVAGIAHEIKNPLNFIYGNTGFLSEYTRKMQTLLEAYDQVKSISAEERRRVQELKGEINYDFICEDLKTLIDNFTEGARRINAIVSDLRTFSRLDSDVISELDIHASLEMSLNLLRNQYTNRVEIHREYGEIPRIQGNAGKLGQVFMNLLSNAFHAVQEAGDVWVRTSTDNSTVEIQIEDNGAGIPKEHLKRIFEPFFTTKAVGQGTGLGLSISYGIIEQHRGRIHVSSTQGEGSIFSVRIPVIQNRV